MQDSERLSHAEWGWRFLRVLSNPFLGVHKHGPACLGEVRSAEAQIACEAEPKEEGETSLLVKLRQCKEDTFFSIGTSLVSNVTLRCADYVEEDDPDWKHQIQARIYLDPDRNGAELLNQSPSLTISVLSGEEEHKLAPGEHFRMQAGRSWDMKMTKLYTFGLILSPTEYIFTALIRGIRSMKMSRVCHVLGEDQDTTECERGEKQGSLEAEAITMRSIDLPGLSELIQQAHEPRYPSETVISKPSGDDSEPARIFTSRTTIVENLIVRGKRRVRKTIRRSNIHDAARSWENEIRQLRTLSHPHIINAIDWSSERLTIDFDYGGKDLARLTSAAGMFSVATELEEVQNRVGLDMASVLSYLHKTKKTMHRDIKPQNILISDDHGTIKLCDLGFATSDNAIVIGSGTHQYIAPEFLTSGITSAASDVWALGVTMLFVLNIIPLPGKEHGAEYWMIHELRDRKEERRKMRKWLRKISQALEEIPTKWSVVREMLDPDPKTRITADALVKRVEQSISLRKRESTALLEL